MKICSQYIRELIINMQFVTWIYERLIVSCFVARQ